MLFSKVVVIGAGPSGLCAAHHSIEKGLNVTVYEQNDDVGGQWLYTDNTGKDEYGLNIHSAMYKNMRTNIATTNMAFSYFPFPNGLRSYISQPDVLEYYDSFANQFDLRKHIRFRHVVIRVTSVEDDKWELIVKNLTTNTFETNIFDAIFVATGNQAFPNIPPITGIGDFEGKMIHSQDYRDAEKFRNERILLIGAGPSAKDFTHQLYGIADRLTLSQHKPPNESDEDREIRKSKLPPNTTLQGDVIRFTKTGAEFLDGSHDQFSVIIFATGYQIKYPFLSADCGIFVKDNFTQPLYKQIINIEHPTMAFIGLTFVNELQVLFALKFITGEKELPTKHEMLSDAETRRKIRLDNGHSIRKMHALHQPAVAWDYLQQLCESAGLKMFPPVFHEVYEDNILSSVRHPHEYKNYNYKIIDDRTFIKETVCQSK